MVKTRKIDFHELERRNNRLSNMDKVILGHIGRWFNLDKSVSACEWNHAKREYKIIFGNIFYNFGSYKVHLGRIKHLQDYLDGFVKIVENKVTNSSDYGHIVISMTSRGRREKDVIYGWLRMQGLQMSTTNVIKVDYT